MCGSPKTTQELIDFYSSIMKIFEKYEIEFILFYGSLLGYIRENNFINNDDDIDVLCHSKHKNFLLSIVQKEKIIQMNILNDRIFQLFLDDVGPFDIFFYEERKDTIYILCCEQSFLKKDIFPLNKIICYGYDIFIPFNPLSILQTEYGTTWTIPIPRIR